MCPCPAAPCFSKGFKGHKSCNNNNKIHIYKGNKHVLQARVKIDEVHVSNSAASKVAHPSQTLAAISSKLLGSLGLGDFFA